MVASYALVPYVGIMVWGCAAAIHSYEFPGRSLAEATTYSGGVVGRPRVQPGSAGDLQIHPGDCGFNSACVPAKFSHLALPLGISFWTFQAMSYLLDLYRGEELDPSFVEFALYMAFFPVTISGPICRMPEMLPQFRSEERISRHDMGRGLCRIATGLLMMQIAQMLGKGILGGEGINGGFDHLTVGAGWMFGVWRLVMVYSSSSISRATPMSPLGPPGFSVLLCRKTLPGHLHPRRRRSSGHAGTCRSRFGFATTYSSLWRSCGGRCGGET